MDPTDLPEDDDRDEVFRGWVAPESRTWRHPSEMGAAGLAAPSAPVDARLHRNSLAVAALCTATVLLASGITLAALGASPTASKRSPGAAGAPGATGVGVGTTTTLVASVVGTGGSTSAGGSQPGGGQSGAAATPGSASSGAAGAAASLVLITSSSGASGIGVAVDANGLVVAPASLVQTGGTLHGLVGGRREPATPLVTDATSGLAVLQLPGPLHAATFADQSRAATTLGPESVVDLDGTGRSRVASASVVSTAAGVGPTAGVATLGVLVAGSGSAADPGSVLLDGSGDVVGVESSASPFGDAVVAAFIPSYVVMGVTDELLARGEIVPGSLDLSAVDAPGGAGALVASISHDGAGELAGLEVGDVITAVNGCTVTSAGELLARLYVEPPGTDVALGIERNGVAMVTSAVLESPGAATTATVSP